MPYNELITNTPLPELEKEILQFWKKENIFQQSVDQRPIDNQFVLYDGPPFATGLPHYGHILAHSIKDVLPRFQTMLGKRVERRFGWDCHGVPVEYEVEKSLQLNGKRDIDKMGIAEFNEACRSIVQRYTNEWRAVEDRLGRFVDMDNDYKTMDLDFMESVWAVFKRINDKGLIYEGKKVVAYSPELGTPLSDFEAKSNYKNIQDPEIVMSFQLLNEPDVGLLVWTTTPWSVPGNVAIALNKNITYVKLTTQDNQKFILAESAVAKYFKPENIKEVTPVAVDVLLGQKYQPQFPTADNTEASENHFTLIESTHVTETDGTGMVHIAPAFGEDDYRLGQQYGLPTLDNFDNNGMFKDDLMGLNPEFSVKGKSFKDADKTLIDYMKKHQRIFHHGTLHHEYPFCWRTDKPLMYRAVPSWYVKVTEIKDKIIANNDKINWYPDYVGKKRFNEWLTNARDWAISRSRYWGTPIPVWRNNEDPNDTIVIGSIEELKAFTGATEITDLHRHFIDDLVVVKDGKHYSRIPEVFDCWFESGAMPYAQAHYPFENVKAFEDTFPADFIAEGLDQTRGWFYTLMVLSTALFDKPAFKNCMVNGILLGDDGKKMSKSKRNYPSMDTVFTRYGADPLRFLLLGSGATQAKEMKVAENDISDVTRLVFIPMLNIYKLYSMQANMQGFQPESASEHELELKTPLDQWLFYTTEKFKAAMKKSYENYDLITACQEVRNFVELYSKLYVRNSKQRFKYAEPEEIRQSLLCMHHALDTLSKCIAPLTPFMGDILYQALYGNQKSVHLQLWPNPINAHQYTSTFNSIETFRIIVRLSNHIRQEQRLELKQPVASINISIELREQLLPHEAMLKEAVNVEKINWVAGDVSDQLKIQITLNEKVLGPKYGKALKTIKAAFKAEEFQLENNVLTLGEHTLTADDFTISYKPLGNLSGAVDGSIWLTMDCALTPELKEKGQLRKLMHEIQMLRKKEKLTPKDFIELSLSGQPQFLQFIDKYKLEIERHTSAVIKVVEAQDASQAPLQFSSDGLVGQMTVAKKAPLSLASQNSTSFVRAGFALFSEANTTPVADTGNDEAVRPRLQLN
jgi:isoleucyl-tRNA synthetase